MNQVVTDGRATRAQDQRRVRKAEILKKAQEIIGQRGYEATTVADVLKAANISRGTFYIYFQSFESLFQELVEDLVSKVQECIQPIRLEDGDPIRDTYANIKRVVDLLFNNPNLTAIFFREAIRKDPIVEKKINGLYTFLYDKVCGALRNGVEWGLIRSVNERVIGMAMIGTVKEVLYQYLVANQGPAPDRDVIVQELLTFSLQGLRP